MQTNRRSSRIFKVLRKHPSISRSTINKSKIQGDTSMRKLEIGSGNRPQEGYEHLDLDPKCPHVEYVAPMDKIPTEDNVFSEVISVHVIEHDSWRKSKEILKEWYRVLAVDGVCIVTTPNLKFICEMYVDGKNGGTKWLKDYGIMHPEEKAHIDIDGVPNLSRWANFKLFSSTAGGDIHYACYDADSLTSLMKQIGFKDIKVEHDGDSLTVKGYKR